MKKYVDVKKEQKRQALLQADVTNTSDDKDEDMEEGEPIEQSLPSTVIECNNYIQLMKLRKMRNKC